MTKLAPNGLGGQKKSLETRTTMAKLLTIVLIALIVSMAHANLQEEFEQAIAAAKKLPSKPDNETLLQMYALLKQGSVGNVQGKRPTSLLARAQWDAWNALRGTSKEDAQQQYIDLIESLFQ